MKKIICVGVNKTGTTSLGVALSLLGYNNIDFTDQNYELFKSSDFNSLGRISQSYDSFTDSPWHLLYKKLDHLYPNSKFILTIRDDEKWINSILGYYDDRIKYNTVAVLLNLIFGEPYQEKYEHRLSEQDKRLFLYFYNKRNAEVIDYFKERDGDLLVVNWEKGDGWGKLCDFLGKEIPEERFPHKMKTVSKFQFYKDYYLNRMLSILKVFK